MARGGVVAVGVVVLAAVAAVAGLWWGFGAPPASVPVVECEDPAEVADAAATGGELAAGRRPGTVASAVVAAGYTATIRGRVTGPKGAPAPGVLVLLRAAGGSDDRGGVDPAHRGKAETETTQRWLASLDAPTVEDDAGALRVTTGPDGRFTVTVDRPSNWSAEARPAPPLCGARGYLWLRREVNEGTISITLATGDALRGRVVDASDAPLAAVVSGAWTAADASGAIAPVATDPATGAFTLGAVGVGNAMLTVRVAGRCELTVRTPVPAPEPFVIRVPAGGTIAGRVTDPAGAALADVDVLITSGPREAPSTGVATVKARGKSAADGSYRVVGLAPGRVQTVTMLAPGRPARTENAWRARWTGTEVRDGAETRLDLVLGRGGVVAGRVLEAGTNAPVVDAEVYLFASQGVGNAEAVRTRVDERGVYRIEDVPFGRYAAMPTSPRHYFAPAAARPEMEGNGNVAADAPVVVISVEGEVVERDLLVTPGLTVKGVVQGPGGALVAGAEIRAANEAPLYQTAWNWSVHVTLGNQPLATSDADGAFTVGNLPPTSELTLYATKPPLVGEASARLTLEAAAPPPPPITLTLAAGATVFGRVLDADGKPIAGRGVNWHSQDPKLPGWGHVTTDGDGAFKAEGVPPTTVNFQTRGSTGRSGTATAKTDPPLQPGELREGVELRVARSSWLRGVAVDASGAPAPRATLVAQGSGQQSFTTADDGTFDVAVPEGTYQLRGRPAPGGGPEGAVTTAKAPAENVRVVVAVVERAFTLVGGKVVAADGTPVPLCTVQVSDGDGQAFRGEEVLGGEFRFELDRKPPFTLVATAPKGSRGEGLNLRSGTRVVEKEATDLVLTLERGLVVRGRVLDPAGTPTSGVVVRAGSLFGTSDATGAFVVAGLASGEPVALQVQPPSRFLGPEGVTARPGGEEVVVRLRPAGFVAGRIVGLDEVRGMQAWIYVQSGGGGRASAVAADGTFRVEGLPAEGPVDLGVNTWSSAGGNEGSPFAPASAKGVRIGSDDVVIVLARGVYVRGVVVDADGAPAQRLHVQAQPNEGGDSVGASTGANGTFTLGAMRAGRYAVSVHGQNGTAATSIPVDAPAENVRIVLPRTQKIAGRVVGGDGKAMGVTVFRKAGAKRSQVGYGQTDGEGRFAVDVTGDGPFAVNVAGPERYGRADPVEPGTEVEIQVVLGLEITGTVEPEARGAAGTWILVEGDGWQAGANSNPDGTFRLRGLPPGRYVLKVFRQEASVKEPGPGTPVDAGATNVRLR